MNGFQYKKYSNQLRILNDAYFNGHVSVGEYIDKRSEIFNMIESDMGMSMNPNDIIENDSHDSVMPHIQQVEEDAGT
jgi:hypothetical protein